MFFNLFSLVIIYIFFFTLILSAGKIANNHILQFKNLSLGEHGLIGFIFLYFLTLCFHFFFPISNFLTSLIFIFLIISFIKNFKEIIKIKRVSFLNLIFIFLFFLLLSITNNHHDDLYIFQLPIINYMQNYKIVFGLINLNDFIGQGHSFYEIMSLFKIPIYENRAYFLLPIIFLNFFVIFLFETLKNENNKLIKYFIYFIIALLIIRFNRSKEYGTDLPILCLLFYIQINLFSFINSKNIEFFFKSLLASLFCIILKLYGVLSLLYLCAFLPLLKKDVFGIFKKKKYVFFLLSIFLLTLSKNIIVSGCFFYPISELCLDKKYASWSIGKEVAEKRNEFYSAQVVGWRSYTKNINQGNFLSAREYLDKNLVEKIKGLSTDKDIEKIITGIVLVLLFIIIAVLAKSKIKVNKINQFPNKVILICIFMPLFIWLIKFPQSRYGFFSYISFLFFYVSYQYFNIGEINKRLIKIFFSILLIFLSTKNILRINSEVNNSYNLNNYPIKKFRSDDYTVKLIDNIKFNIPKNSFMECSNIPMLCAAKEKMIKKSKVINGYYFLENNSSELIKHIQFSAIYDMVETNN